MRFKSILLVLIFFAISLGAVPPEKKTIVNIEKIKKAGQLYERGMVEYRKKQFEKASEMFRKSIGKCREFSDSWYMMAKLNYRDKRYNAAYSSINKAIRYFPIINRGLVSAKAEEIVALKLRQKRVENILDAENRRMNCRSRKDEIQGYEIELSQIKDRIRSLGGVNSEAGLPADYSFFAGNICLKLGKSKQAYNMYCQSLESNPEYEPAWTNLLVLLLSGKNHEAARSKLKEAEKLGVKINRELRKKIVL